MSNHVMNENEYEFDFMLYWPCKMAKGVRSSARLLNDAV
jgi:hypothetical protein